MTVTTWSYSAYALYTECPAKYKYAKIDKLPDPAGKAMLRGRQVHKEIENFLKQPTTAFPVVATRFSGLLYALAEQPKLLVEQQWAFNRNWGQARWMRDDTTWLRSIVDAGTIYPDYSVELVDWKTGKRYETNDDQMELFGLSGLVRYPEAPSVTTRLAYVDKDVPEANSEVFDEFKAADREKLKRKWEQKVVPMFTDTVFAPRPNDNCKWCNFSRAKGGPCRF